MKCWHEDHDELRRGDFIYRGAAGRGMGGLVGGGMSMNVIDLMTLIEYTFTCIGIGIAIERYFKHKK